MLDKKLDTCKNSFLLQKKNAQVKRENKCLAFKTESECVRERERERKRPRWKEVLFLLFLMQNDLLIEKCKEWNEQRVRDFFLELLAYGLFHLNYDVCN